MNAHVDVMADRPAWDHKLSGYVCPQQVIYEYQGEVWRRDCGHCARCVARKKRDVAGRAGAEALTAQEVCVWTLTYRDGNAGAVDFVTKDRQAFIMRLRDWLRRNARRQVGAPKRNPKGAAAHVAAYWKYRTEEVLPKVRYLGCGERGKRSTRRCHWHLVFFFSKPSGLRSTPEERPGKPGRENHDLWPWGFVNIDVLPHDMSAKMRAVRYCVKYTSKSMSPKIDGLRRGDKAEAKFFRSNATPLGYEFLVDEARRYAEAGLPISGKYRVPGVRHSRTRKPGADTHTVHQLTGRMRDHFIEAYHAEWERLRPDRPVPMTPWLLRYSEYAVQGTGDVKVRPRRKQFAPVEPPLKIPPRVGCRELAMPIFGAGPYRGQDRGLVLLDRNGEAVWCDPDGTEWPIPGRVSDVVSGLTAKQAAYLEARIYAARGPGWISERERRQMIHERGRRLTDSMRAWAKPGVNPMPPHLPSVEPLTAMMRKLYLNGYAHVPGTVVKDGRGGVKEPAFISRGAYARKPVKDREA